MRTVENHAPLPSQVLCPPYIGKGLSVNDTPISGTNALRAGMTENRGKSTHGVRIMCDRDIPSPSDTSTTYGALN